MKRFLYAVATAAVIASCDFTKERGPEEINVKGSSAIWAVETDGSSNYASFVSRSRIPAGTELRILIDKVGNEGNLQLANWETRTEVQAWIQDALTPTQVLSYRVVDSSRYALEVGGVNFWKEPRTINDEADGTSVMSFDSGWKLRVKLIPRTF